MTLEKAARIAKCSLMPSRPYHVQWFLTNRCNYRCRSCNVWRKQDGEELPVEEVKEGLDVLKALGVIEVVLSGGAPLLRDDIGEIINYASRFFVTTVYDNGSLAGEKIEALRRADFVAISLDTLDADKNDHAKGVKGSWDKAMKSIEVLHREGVQVSVTPTISQINFQEILPLTKYFLERDIPVWYSLYSYDSPTDSNQHFMIGKKSEDLEIADKNAMVKLCGSLDDLRRHNSNMLVTGKLLKAMKQFYSCGERAWKCRALRNFLIVDHLGRVAGCHLHNPVASIFDLPEKWQGTEFEALRKTYSKCSECTYLCYIFYSLHGSVIGNLQIAQERWRNTKMLLKKNHPTSLAWPKPR